MLLHVTIILSIQLAIMTSTEVDEICPDMYTMHQSLIFDGLYEYDMAVRMFKK